MLFLLPVRRGRRQRKAPSALTGELGGGETGRKTRTRQPVPAAGKVGRAHMEKKSINLNFRFSFACRKKWEEKIDLIYES